MMTWLCLTVMLSSVAIEHVQVQVGDGRTLEDSTVVWDKGVITGVGVQSVPAGAERIDGRGKILTPGLIETRTRLGISEVDQEDSTTDYSIAKEPATPAFHAADGFNPASVRIPIVRREGITSAITAPGTAEHRHGRVIYGTGSWIDLNAKPGPLPPVAMYAEIGRAGADAVGGARGAVWMLLRDIVEDTRFYSKAQLSYEHGASRRLILRPAHLRAMAPVLAGKLPLVANADRADDILRIMAFARSEGVHLIISGGSEAWLVAPQLAEQHVPVILRPSTQQPNSFDELQAREDAAAVLAKAGVHVIISAGHENQDLVRLRHEAGMAVSLGLPHGAALQAVTLAPAQAFGKDRELGSVTVGKRANLVLWSGDPFETRTVAEKVWIDGTLQPRATRQDALVQRYLHRSKAPTADKNG